ncbi:MAG: hypothetical protein PCFJNLEI_01857 [Verrucomicrobiae bacterium]|nr:hypothetical protein [Verrucomicrobiae bacterium]
METILAQTITDWELIVCDSFSNDGSWEFFQQYKSDPRIRLHQVPRAGVYAGWNECLRRATGEFVYIATSDDTMEPTCLQELRQCLESHSEILMATCNFRCIDERSQPLPINCNEPTVHRLVYGDILAKAHIRNSLAEFVTTCVAGTVWGTITAALFRRSLLDQTGLFAENKQSIADFEWGLRACLCTDMAHVPKTLATWRMRPGQTIRTLDWARHTWLYVTMIEATLDQFRHRLPESLRTAQARRRLTYPMAVRAFQALNLYPGVFCRHPYRTVVNLCRGLHRFPRLTLRHLFRGGRWTTRETVDHRLYLAGLLAEFQLPPLLQTNTTADNYSVSPPARAPQ